MIVTEPKPLEEVRCSLEGFARIAVFGCGSCATLAGTGGEKEVREMVELIKPVEVVYSAVIDTACHERLAAREVKKAVKAGAEAILVLACGSGVQNVADVTDLPVLPGLNTVFIGKTKRPGEFYEYCSACGSCVLAETAGICPKTRCPKSMLNGPCGGMHHGRCEVYPDQSCVWVEIYRRNEEKDQMLISDHSSHNSRPRRKG